MTSQRITWVALVSLNLMASIPLAARADALSDLNAKLRDLQAPTPLKGMLDVRSTDLGANTDPSESHDAHLQLAVSEDNGLDIHLDPVLLRKIDVEDAQHAADGNQPEPTSELLSDAGPEKIQHMLSTAAALLWDLDGATLVSAKPDAQTGGTSVALSLPLHASKKDSGDVKDFRHDIVLTLDAHGVPLAYHDTTHAKFCKFFLCVTVDETHDATLEVVDGRLVTVSLTAEHKQSGLGQGAGMRVAYALRLQ